MPGGLYLSSRAMSEAVRTERTETSPNREREALNAFVMKRHIIDL